jgi:hypothetical protein
MPVPKISNPASWVTEAPSRPACTVMCRSPGETLVVAREKLCWGPWSFLCRLGCPKASRRVGRGEQPCPSDSFILDLPDIPTFHILSAPCPMLMSLLKFMTAFQVFVNDTTFCLFLSFNFVSFPTDQ